MTSPALPLLRRALLPVALLALPLLTVGCGPNDGGNIDERPETVPPSESASRLVPLLDGFIERGQLDSSAGDLGRAINQIEDPTVKEEMLAMFTEMTKLQGAKLKAKAQEMKDKIQAYGGGGGGDAAAE